VTRPSSYLALTPFKVTFRAPKFDLSNAIGPEIEKLYPALSERLVLTCKIPDDIEKKRAGFRLSELDAFLENAASGNVKL